MKDILNEMIATDAELLAGIDRALAAGTMTVFSPATSDVNEIMAMLRPDPWGQATSDVNEIMAMLRPDPWGQAAI